MNLVVDVEVQAAKAKLAFRIGNVSDDVLRTEVFQINHGGVGGGFLFINYRSAHGPQLGFTALGLALREQRGCRQRHERDQGEPSKHVHGFPSEARSIRSVRSSWLPSRASSGRVCVLKPRASIVNSYSAPCFTLIPSSPRRSDTASQRNFGSSARRTRTRAPGRAKPWSV